MSDFSLINKTAHRIYPTHLKEVDNSSFSWSGVLPTDAKSRLVKDSEGHKQTDDRNSHTLTHKLKGGASIEFNITRNGKNNIAMAKYHKGGKLFTAIHSHEDPSTAIKTAYDSVARRIVTEEAEIALIEKMEKRIEKKTGKLSDKKEKIDVEPSEEKELKESRVVYHLKHHKDDKKYYLHVHEAGKEQGVIPLDTSDAHEARMKGLDHVLDARHKQGIDAQLKESTPPGMESWVKKNKAHFVKEYGEKKGHEVLYATAWKLHNKMNEMEELNESKFISNDGREFTTEKGRTDYRPEVHHVFHNGEHVGYVHQDEIQPYKKIAGSRLVKPLAKRKVWNFHLDPGHSLDGKSVKYRDSSGFGSKKAALEGLARYHKSSKLAEAELKEGTIEVIPHFIGVMPDGRKVSPFSAGIHHVEKTGKWTWGVTDHNGNYTTGMSRTPVSSKEEAAKIAHDVAAKTGYRVKLHEEQLNEVAIGHTVKLQSGQHLHVTGFKFAKGAQLGPVPRVGMVPLSGSKVTHYIGYLGSTPVEASRASKKVEIPIERVIEGSELNSMGRPIKRKKLIEAHAYTKEGLAKQIKYHENRAAHHDSEAQTSFNKAQDLTGDKADLHFNAAKGHKAIADLHRKHIYDLKSSVGMNEAELNELSPHTLGMYTKLASIDMAHHRATGAISHRAQIDAESRGSKESAKTHEDNKIQHDKKATKRLNGIIKATDKLVRKAVVKEEQLKETRAAPHPDKVVMTSSIRKDLGGGYMAKTRNGHFYKLDINAFGEPGKGRELPKLGAVLDTSKHKFIGKDKVDLNLLKESAENNYLGQLVGKYITHSGKTGMEIRRHPIGTYSYSGEWGAGGGHSKVQMDKTANMLLRLHPRHKIEKHYFGDVHNIKEELDYDHPDMKAYHAACKARDEAHLASIRYRMNHDIKQPAHRAKYDELEAEHHRLRDIEDQASEKVHGRLFAHHAGFKE